MSVLWWVTVVPGAVWPRDCCDVCGHDVDECECHDLLHDRPHHDIGTGRPARTFRKRREEQRR